MRIILKKYLSFSIFLFIFASSLSVGLNAQAQEGNEPPASNNNLFVGQEGMTEVQGVFGAPVDIRTSISNIINMVLGFLGVIFLILIIIAGFNYMTAGGNDEKVKKAITQISQAVIGLIVVLSAWGLTLLIMRMVVGASKGYSWPYFF